MWRLAKFSIVGVIASLTYFIASYALVILFNVNGPIASVSGYLVGMIISFFGQGHVTFNSNHLSSGQFLRFCLLSAFGLLFSFVSVFVVVDLLQWRLIWALLATVIVVPLVNFLVMQVWVFYTAPEKQAP